MAEEIEVSQTLLQKLIFYTTAFFILLGTFSLFAFLFLVPFVIEPAFTTMFMDFEPVAAFCVTVDTEHRQGASNCSWSSCREGCTKEVYDCTQIRVNYKILPREMTGDEDALSEGGVYGEDEEGNVAVEVLRTKRRMTRAIREYDYAEGTGEEDPYEDNEFGANQVDDSIQYPEGPEPTGLMGNNSEWYFTGARLFPNVKGCGYPPILNCSIFLKQYRSVGTNFSCYYSRVDPGLVISDLDMWQNTLNLVYAMAIPIPSFILSVIYLTVAYFKIYNEDEEEQSPLGENAEGIDGEGDEEELEGQTGLTPVTPLPNGTPLSLNSGGLTPGSDSFTDDLTSFGHQLKVQMADEMSRESIDALPISNSASYQG